MNVAVTAVGGGVGQSIIKALQRTTYSVVGINSEALGAGLYATSKSYLGFNANDPKFISRLQEICSKENCKILFPGLDVELAPLSKNIDEFKASGILPIVSDPTVIDICGDKMETNLFLKKNGFPYPKTYLLENYNGELDFPFILKPRKGGHRSIGLFRANNEQEFEEILASIEPSKYIVQEYIEGDEFTCGTINFDGECKGVVLMKRELRNGDTIQAFVVRNNKLATFVRNVVDKLGPFGACNVQLRIKNQVPYIFEFNARCSGTTACRALAGFNEPKMVCDYVLRNIKTPKFAIREIAILRYWKELVIDSAKTNDLIKQGFAENRRAFL